MVKLSGIPKKSIQSLGMGVFDGMHLAHQAILDRCDCLLSFSPHPDIVLRKEAQVPILSTPREMRSMTKNVIFLTFTKAVASLSADAFLNEVILSRLAPKKIVVGYDFRFGAKQSGTPDYLQAWGQQHGIDIDIVPPVSHHDEIVKSALIRQLIQADQFDRAVLFLGHPYRMIGRVINGEGRGKELGFPTANLAFPSSKCLPAPGVYAAKVHLDTIRPAIVYVGSKPTFNGKTLGVEVHIPDYQENIYGKQLKLDVLGHIRGEKTFANREALVAQIGLDLSKLHNML